MFNLNASNNSVSDEIISYENGIIIAFKLDLLWMNSHIPKDTRTPMIKYTHGNPLGGSEGILCLTSPSGSPRLILGSDFNGKDKSFP